MIPEVEEDRYRELRVFSYRILYKILDEEKDRHCRGCPRTATV